MDETRKVWDEHYRKEKSRLHYPDENLVRLLSSLASTQESFRRFPKKALDLGAGSGRHIPLLLDYAYEVTAADYSLRAIESIRQLYPHTPAFFVKAPPYPFADSGFDLVVAWGVLHYNPVETVGSILDEIYRILKPGGCFLGTLRAEKDTSLLGNPDDGSKNTLLQNSKMDPIFSIIQKEDLSGGYIELYDLNKAKKLLSHFSNLEFGYMERTPIGKLEERICHYFFRCFKDDSIS